MIRELGISAVALEFVTVMPTAPATCTFELAPDESEPAAEAPVVLALPLPGLAALARLLAWFCCAVALLLTSPLLELPSASALPPATLARARDLLAPVVWALKPTAPPAVMLREVVASTVSVAIVSASEMPTPVLPDSVSPSATLSTLPS